MNTTNQFYPLLLTGVLIILVICPGPASAISVVGAKYVGTVSPGDTVTHTMTVSIMPTDPPMDIVVAVRGSGPTGSEHFSLPSAAEDTNPYSARKFITLDTGSFHLNPGESKEIMATIVIPEDAGDGVRYAVISFHNAPTGDESTAYVTEISIPFMITINHQALHAGTAAVSGKPKKPKSTVSLDVRGTHAFGQTMVVGDNVNTTANTVRTTVISNVPWILTVGDALSNAKPSGTEGKMAEWDGISRYTVRGKVLTNSLNVGSDKSTWHALSKTPAILFTGTTAGTFVNYPYFKQTIVIADPHLTTPGHVYRIVVTFDVRAS